MGLTYVGHGATSDGIGNYHSMFTTGEPLGAGLYYSDPEIDRLNQIALSTLAVDEQLAAIHSVAEKVAEDALAVFLFHPVEIYAVREGIDFNPMPSEHLDLISGWVFERILD